MCQVLERCETLETSRRPPKAPRSCRRAAPSCRADDCCPRRIVICRERRASASCWPHAHEGIRCYLEFARGHACGAGAEEQASGRSFRLGGSTSPGLDRRGPTWRGSAPLARFFGIEPFEERANHTHRALASFDVRQAARMRNALRTIVRVPNHERSQATERHVRIFVVDDERRRLYV